jgi:hypothetical protein
MSGTTSEVMRFLVVVLLVGNVLALVVGLSLLIVPRKIIKLFSLNSVQPLTLRRVSKSLEMPRNSEKVMLRYPRVLGAALLAGGVFVLIKWSLFVSTLDAKAGGQMLMRLYADTHWPSAVWESLWLTMLVLILVGALFAILIGVLALVRVQTLKSLSSFTSRWVSTRQAAKPISRPYYGIDRFVATHPQALGGVIALLSMYTLIMILWSSGRIFN